MKRLVGLIVLLVLAAAGLYYWRARPEPPIRLDAMRLPAPAAVRQRFGDAALRLAVLSAFALHRRLRDHGLEVEVTRGAVRLSGEVPSRELEDLALAVARDVVGVSSVTDEIRVREQIRRRGP